jgi:AAA domain-containing protein/primase/DNA polymerase family protein
MDNTARDFDIYEDTGERQDRLFPKAASTGSQQQSVAQASTDVVRHLPEELKKIPNFLLWAMVQVSGKLTKKPLQIDGTAASSTNPATWASYEDVCRAQPTLSSTEGIGFALGKTGCGYTFVDMDGARNPIIGEMAPWASEFIVAHPTYCEITPSGFGLRCIFRGQPALPNGKHIDKWRMPELPGIRAAGYDKADTCVEIFTAEKYVTVTGDVYGLLRPIADCNGFLAGLPEKTVTASDSGEATDAEIFIADFSHNEKFGLLFAGDWGKAGYGSQSEADCALATMLAYTHGNDPEKIDSEFRKSGLYREKWEREDYRERTIERGIKYAADNPIEAALPESERGYTLGLKWFQFEDDFLKEKGRQAVAKEKSPAAGGEYGGLQTYSELRLRRQNAKPYLVNGICRLGQIVMVVGDSTLGKSSLVNQLGWAVATGQPFLGRATQQAKALIIDIENSADQQLELAECFRKMFNQPDFPESIAVPESVWTDVAGQKQVEHFISTFDPGIVIIDSLKSFQSEAEKAGRENGLFMQWARRITKTYDCAMVLVHHPRKPSAEANVDAPWLGDDRLPVITWMNGAAGAKGLINLADVRWGVDRSRDERECFVMRINERTVGDSGVMRVIREYDDEGREAGYVLRHGLSLLTDQQIEKFMTLAEQFHFTDVCAACGGAKSVASRLINRAVQAGALKKIGRGKYEKTHIADRGETEARLADDKLIPF